MEMTERKLKILQAVVSDYISSAEPVGSRNLSRKFDLGVSPATIRNEMSDLEAMGYLTHPHTSAGRVPSDLGYRLYVDELMKKTELSSSEKRVITERLHQDMTEFDEVIKHAASLLSEITNLTSFAISPSSYTDRLKFVNLLPVDEETVILMTVSESGRVSNTTLKMTVPYNEEMLQILSKNMTYHYGGRKLTDVMKDDMIAGFESDIKSMSKLMDDIKPDFIKTLEDMLDVNLYVDGFTNIFDIPEYNNRERAKSFFTLLERKEAFMKKIVERDDGIIVTIGDENADDMMNDCSLITATYHVDGEMVGKIGVIGPTRMKYSEITSIVEYLTDNLNDTFKLESGDDKK